MVKLQLTSSFNSDNSMLSSNVVLNSNIITGKFHETDVNRE